MGVVQRRTPDDAFISWVDGRMTTMGESRKGAHSPNSSLANPKTALTWVSEGKRKRGRPREAWRRTVERELEKEGLRTCAAASAAEDRTAWRQRAYGPILPLGERINDDDTLKDEYYHCLTSDATVIVGRGVPGVVVWSLLSVLFVLRAPSFSVT